MSTELRTYSLKDFNQVMNFDKTKEFIKSKLGEKSQEFVANITALVTNSALLQQCEPWSVFYAAINATVLDLPLNSNLGFAYVIPYKNAAQFQIGYKGFIQLAIRSGQYEKINVTDVREGEIISFDLTTGEYKLKKYTNPQELEERNNKPIIGYLGYFKLVNGFEKYAYWCNDKLKRHAMRYSKTYDAKWSVYKSNEAEMYSKTVLKNLLNKWGILSIEMQNAIKYDQAIISDEDKVEYLDNPEQNTEHSDKINSILSSAFESLTTEEQNQGMAALEADIIEKQKKDNDDEANNNNKTILK